MPIADYHAACELYDGLRGSAVDGTPDWNNEVAVAWEFVVETAVACAANAEFMDSSEGTAFAVSAQRRGALRRRTD